MAEQLGLEEATKSLLIEVGRFFEPMKTYRLKKGVGRRSTPLYQIRIYSEGSVQTGEGSSSSESN